MMPTPQEAEAVLANRDLAVSAALFPTDREAASAPGLYSWWVDDVGRAVLEGSLESPLTSLIYAGQAGATSSRSARASTATLGSRILTNHIRGTAYGSTFRKTLSAILLEPLGLRLDKSDHLIKPDNDRVSTWIRQHLSVVIYPYDDRETLGRFEEDVLRILDPPLNLDGMAPTPVRARLTALRRQITRPALPDTIPVEEAGPDEVVKALETQEVEPGEVRFMVPTGGPDAWRLLLADPELHWVVGRSARTMAHAWEDADGWPAEIRAALDQTPELAGLQPVYGFPEFKTPLPGGRRASQTDLLVIASDADRRATFAIEGKVDETFGDLVSIWLGSDPSPGKRQRLAYLAGLLSVEVSDSVGIRYQLIHRAAAAKIEGARNGSEIAVMLVHSWGPQLDGFADFGAFARLLGVEGRPGEIRFSQSADLWIGLVTGDSKYLAY
jgi:hypothetical protein